MSKKYESTLEFVRDTVENEGLAYAILHYSDFTEVQDVEFHRLKNAFTEAAEELEEYLENN